MVLWVTGVNVRSWLRVFDSISNRLEFAENALVVEITEFIV